MAFVIVLIDRPLVAEMTYFKDTHILHEKYTCQSHEILVNDCDSYKKLC